jgi:fibronectin-binding autotransporter adhesin
LTLSGNTTLGHSAHLSYELGTPGVIGSGVNSLTEVHGNLNLGAILDVTGLTGFGTGTYRLMDYTGAFTNNLPNIGSLPQRLCRQH